jgi:alpha/beta superfamily hydrolase
MIHAVLLHPHFVYGGDQDNRVISAIHDRLTGSPVTPHRFTFSSPAGTIARAEALAQVEACDGPVVLVGYSFGGEIAAQIDHPAVVGWALIAPALVLPQFVSPASPLRPPPEPPIGADPRPKLVVTAGRDAWFGADVLGPLTSGWAACTERTLPDADHFFSATTGQVADLVTEWVVTRATDILTRSLST